MGITVLCTGNAGRVSALNYHMDKARIHPVKVCNEMKSKDKVIRTGINAPP